MTEPTKDINHVFSHEDDFRPGVYRHYKGGLYLALALARCHDTGESCVVYVSMTTGEYHTRVYIAKTKDAWCDEVNVGQTRWVKRFEFVGVQPLPPAAIQVRRPR